MKKSNFTNSFLISSRQIIAAIVFALVLINPLTANAAFVKWILQSEVTSVSSELSAYASIGDVINLQYTFDPNTPDYEPGVLERGKYENSIFGLNLTINSDIASWNSASGTGFITVLNNYYGSDSYSMQAAPDWDISLPQVSGYELSLVSLGTNDLIAQVFSDTSILSDPYSYFSNYFLNIVFMKPIGPSLYQSVSIRSTKLISAELVAVPEPGSVMLMFLGMPLIFWLKKRSLQV